MSLIQQALKKAQGGPSVPIPLGIVRYGRGRASGGRVSWRLLGAAVAAAAVLFFTLQLPTSFLRLGPAAGPLPSAPHTQLTPREKATPASPPAPNGSAAPAMVGAAPLPHSVASTQSPAQPTPQVSPPESLPVIEQPQPALPEPARPEMLASTPALRRPVEEAKPAFAPQGQVNPPPSTAKEASKETIIKPVVEGKDRYHFNIGLFYQKQREYARAFEAYQKAAELNPFHAEAYNNLGVLYKEIGDLEKAIQHYRKALAVDPNYEKAYNNLGVALIRQGELEEAATAFERALILNPKNLESYTNLGVIYRRRNLIPEALRAFEAALSIDPEHAETHYNIALLMEGQGRIPEAVQHYRRFVTNARPYHRRVVARVITHIHRLTQGAAGPTSTRKYPQP
ncbi:MAG: tetratricopeptide repeat protein [Candidatus Methylomirabilales bacterium]